jgi:sugar phosphate permease
VISDAIAFTVFAVVIAVICGIMAVLVRNGKRTLAGIITACLGIAAVIILLIAYTSDDDYVALFALLIGELAGFFAIAGLIGFGLGLVWLRKRG